MFLPAREEEPSQDLNTTHIPVVLSTVVLLPSMGCCFPTSQGRVGVCHGCSESVKPFGGKWGGLGTCGRCEAWRTSTLKKSGSAKSNTSLSIAPSPAPFCFQTVKDISMHCADRSVMSLPTLRWREQSRAGQASQEYLTHNSYREPEQRTACIGSLLAAWKSQPKES